MSNSKVIIFTGFLATLKSTISKKMSDYFQVPVIQKDHLKEILAETIGFQNREENLKLSKAAFQIIKMMLKQSVESHFNLIIESNFKQDEMNELLVFLKSHLVETLIIELSGDSKTLYSRYLERQPTRHPAHLSAGTMSLETFENSLKNYQYNYSWGQMVQFDTTYYNDKIEKEIYHTMELFLKKSFHQEH